MTDVTEPMFIQAFIAKASVKTLNKSVLCRLAGLDKPQFYAMLKGPLIERAAGKFRALISSYRSRVAAKQRNAVQNTRDLHTRNPKGNSDRQAFLREVVHAGKALDAATGGQCVHDEIHRPGQIGRRRTEQRQTFCCQPFTTSSAFYAQATEVIKPVHALMINMKPFTAQQLPDATVAKTPALQCQLSDAP